MDFHKKKNVFVLERMYKVSEDFKISYIYIEKDYWKIIQKENHSILVDRLVR